MSDSFTLYHCTGCKYFLGEEDFTPSRLKINSKRCKGCRSKSWIEYNKNNKEKLKQRNKKWRKNNKEKISKYKKKYRINNLKHIKEVDRQYVLNNKTKIKESKTKYKENNREKISKQQKQYRDNKKCIHDIHRNCPICHPTQHIANISRSRIYQALKKNKELSSTEYIGCEYSFLRKYITDQFTGEMSWEKYSKGLIHIDHIIPLQYKEDGVTPPTLDIVIERLHYTNLQPLWAADNIAKGNRYIG
jgi:hypothetical protein